MGASINLCFHQHVVKDGETIEKALSMVPIRITVVVTLRELQPLAEKTHKQVRVDSERTSRY